MIDTPLVWYTSKESQSRYTCQTCCFNLYVVPAKDGNGHALIPFITKAPTIWGLVTEWRIFDLNDNEILNLDTKISTLLYKPVVEDGRMVIYNGQGIGTALTEGCYYSRLTFATSNKLYSEVFTASSGKSKEGIILSRIEWTNSCDFGGIPYSIGYKNFINIQSRPYIDKINITEEGVEDGVKNFTPTLQKFQNVFQIREYLPTYLLNSISTLQLHNSIKYYEQYTDTDYIEMKHVKVAVDFDEDEDDYRCNGILKVDFYKDDGVIKTPCCDTVPVVTADANFAVGTLSNIVATVRAANIISGVQRGVDISGDIAGTVDAIYIEGFPTTVNSGNPQPVNITGSTFAWSQDLPAGNYILKIYPTRTVNTFTIKGLVTTINIVVI